MFDFEVNGALAVPALAVEFLVIIGLAAAVVWMCIGKKNLVNKEQESRRQADELQRLNGELKEKNAEKSMECGLLKTQCELLETKYNSLKEQDDRLLKISLAQQEEIDKLKSGLR